MLGLYLHIPFCSSICNYCNFNRGLFDLTQGAVRRCAARARDRTRARPRRRSGRHHLLRRRHAVAARSCRDRAAHRGLPRAFDVAADAEVTLETNPETSTPERMARFREAGVNRISFGVQSFSDDELQRLGRIHSAERARDAVPRRAPPDSTTSSLDLMMWLPRADACRVAARPSTR